MRVSETLSDEALESLWNSFDWEAANEALLKMQREIAFASIKRDFGKVKSVQRKLTRALEPKMLAVREVSDKFPQAGIDDVKWEAGAEKMRAALALNQKNYQAQPMRLLIVKPKGHAKSRHIQIPTYFDRAMQTLYSYSLDPVSESTGDRKSFAFRKGRSPRDAHAYLLKAFDMADPPQYVVSTDIKSCYGSISHRWLLDNIPMDTRVLEQFLKAGHVFGGELFPSEDFGIALGASISTILGNMTLDGAQQAVFEGIHGRGYDVDYANGNLLRFADDIIVTARTKETAEKILNILRIFFAERGLSLSAQKTKIVDLEDGFEFLSWSYKYEKLYGRGYGNVRAEPSSAAIEKMERELRDLITPYRGSQKALIDKLNRKLAGWANYHKVTDARQAFRRIDDTVRALLLELCEKLHPKWPRSRVIGKYFYQESDGFHIYALAGRPSIRLNRLANTILIIHRPMETKKHPYIDTDHYEKIDDRREIMNVSGKYKQVWIRQDGKCYYCGKPILVDRYKTIVTIDPARPENVSNFAYVHEHCSVGQAEFYNIDTDVHSLFDLNEMLTRLLDEQQKTLSRHNQFDPLEEHFRQRTESVVTLAFDEIDKILGKTLCNSARRHKYYWYNREPHRISHCWLSNGYKIKSLRLDKEHVVFEKVVDMPPALSLPARLTGGVPVNLETEFYDFCNYLIKKYGL